MKTPRFFLTGVVFAIAASAASNDQLAEERYRMKYGRILRPKRLGGRRWLLGGKAQWNMSARLAAGTCLTTLPSQ